MGGHEYVTLMGKSLKSEHNRLRLASLYRGGHFTAKNSDKGQVSTIAQYEV